MSTEGTGHGGRDVGSAPGDGPGQDPGGPLEQLIRVQDLDISIAQLEHRRANLAERRDLEALGQQLAALERTAGELGAERQALVDRQGALEVQIAELTARRKALEDRLYADRGSASRDLQAMESEVRHLTQRRSELEETELGIMEDQEPVDAALGQVATERAALSDTATALAAELTRAESVVEAEMAEVVAARGQAARQLPTDLADRYEVLRARLGGIGAARLVGNRCEGCHLELPAKEVDQIRHLPPGTVVTCDQCGRILVRAAARS